MQAIITNSEKETLALAREFAKTLKGGEIIGLIGDLGAGKTIFAKGLAAGLGVKNTVTSPTFVLMKIYKIKRTTSKIKQLVHIDAYRLQPPTEAADIGLTDYFNKKNILLIEWPQNIKIKTTILITIESSGESRRTIKTEQNN